MLYYSIKFYFTNSLLIVDAILEKTPISINSPPLWLCLPTVLTLHNTWDLQSTQIIYICFKTWSGQVYMDYPPTMKINRRRCTAGLRQRCGENIHRIARWRLATSPPDEEWAQKRSQRRNRGRPACPAYGLQTCLPGVRLADLPTWRMACTPACPACGLQTWVVRGCRS